MVFPSTMIVHFSSEADAENAFQQEDLVGTKVSQIFPRYAVEVPAGQEQRIAQFLKEQYQAQVNEVFLTAKERLRIRRRSA